MKCLSCYGDVESGAARCQSCGFPVLLTTENTKEAQEARKLLGEQYRKKKLSGILLRIDTYTYKYQSGHLSLAEKKEMILANAADLKVGEKIWHDRRFGTAGKSQIITIPVTLTFGDGSRTVNASVNVPETEGFNYVGVALDEGLSVRIVVGDRNNYGSSEAFRLIEQEG